MTEMLSPEALLELIDIEYTRLSKIDPFNFLLKVRSTFTRATLTEVYDQSLTKPVLSQENFIRHWMKEYLRELMKEQEKFR